MLASHSGPPSSPDDQRRHEQELHERLLAGHRWATDDLTSYFFPRLLRRLRRDFAPLRDDPELEECVLTPLLDYYRAPQKYRPEKGPLESILYLAARRDALNLLQKRGRQRELPPAGDSVAEDQISRKERVEEEALALVPGLPEEVPLGELEAQLQASLKPGDHPIIPLVLSERAPFESYVAVLGLEGLSRQEQERQVKQAKDRVHAAKARLKKRYRHDG